MAKFTEKAPSLPVDQELSKNKNDDLLDKEFIAPKNEMEVKFVNYINFKNTDNYKYSKSLSLNMLYRSLATSGSLILMLILCGIITNFTGGSTLYYVFFISALGVAVFYPILYLLNMDKFRLKYQKTTYQPNIKKHLLIVAVIVLAIFMLCIIVNISINNNSISKIFGFKNFANLYAPLLFTCVLFLDLFYHRLFISKLQK